MTLLLYDLLLWFYAKVVLLASIWNPKAKKWVEGRKNVHESLSGFVAAQNSKDIKFIWMHCASLGEFEQGRPVLESIKEHFPGHKIVLTFFSPSGYEIRKNYQGADIVLYLPNDSKKNARRFLEILNPSLVIFVKYEFWFHYLHELKKKNIPTIIISAIFRPHQPFFKWYGRLHRYMLSCYTQIFVQNNHSQELLNGIDFTKNVTVSGDTRFDRVLDTFKKFVPIEGIEAFKLDKKTMVAGSTWTDDEALLQHLLVNNKELKLILAPHEIHESHLNELKNRFPFAIFHSQLKNNQPIPESTNCLIIDNIGMLSRLYHYADITYIGGGFNKSGIHNTLEAAVYSKPVLFGPNYSKFKEARDLIENGAAYSVKDKVKFIQIVDELLTDPISYEKAANNAGSYVSKNAGATEKIVSYIQENRLLTN